jgi:type II secretory pathway component PulF
MSLFPTFAKYLAARGIDSRATQQGLFATFFGIFLPTSSGQRRALAELLALGLDERLDLAPLLEAWAADERGWQAARVRKLAKLVAAGMPLDAALARVRGALRPQDATALAVAMTLHGNATEALAGFSAPAASTEPVERGIRWVLGYAATILLVSLPTLVFLVVRLVPMFKKILDDFGMEESPWMTALGWLGNCFATFWYLPLLAILVANIASRLTPRAWAGLRRTLGLGGLGVLGDARAADWLGSLDVAARAGEGEEQAAQALATGTIDRGLRSTLKDKALGPDRAARSSRAGVLSPAEAAALDASPEAGWVTRALSRRHRERILERMWLLSDLILPAFVMAMGLFVFILAMGVMEPLFDLIRGLA